MRERFELEPGTQIDVLIVIDRPLGERDRHGRAGCNLPRELVGLGHELFGRDHGVHDSEPERLGRIDRVPRKDELTGFRGADDARQEPAPAPVRAIPRLTKAWENFAALDAMRMSHASARFIPAPAAAPLIAAMIGFGQSRMARMIRSRIGASRSLAGAV